MVSKVWKLIMGENCQTTQRSSVPDNGMQHYHEGSLSENITEGMYV